MNERLYLLLRDNKRSGPFTLNDIQDIGLKDNDLIWVEEQSTYWQAPTEIEELLAFTWMTPQQEASRESAPTADQIQIYNERLKHIQRKNGKVQKEKAVSVVTSPAEPPPAVKEKISFLPLEESSASKQTEQSPERITVVNKRNSTPTSGTSLAGGTDTPSEVNKEVITVIIADDHTLFREGVKTALSLKPDLKVIAEASNGQQLMLLLKEHRPQVILLDIQMPIMDGLTALKNIRKLYGPDIKIIMLSMHDDHSMVSALMQAGANAYLTKIDDSETIYKAIQTCREKNYYFNELTNLSLLEGIRQPSKKTPEIRPLELNGADLMLKMTAAQKKQQQKKVAEKRWRAVFIVVITLLILSGTAISIQRYATDPAAYLPAWEFSSASTPTAEPPSGVNNQNTEVSPLPVTPHPPADASVSTVPETAQPVSATETATKAGQKPSEKIAKKDKGKAAIVDNPGPTVTPPKEEPKTEKAAVAAPESDPRNLIKKNIYNLVTASSN
ncbi:MAG: response regulator, partial [Chitinophagaceae bacterium]